MSSDVDSGAAYILSWYGFPGEELTCPGTSDGDECGGVGGRAQDVAVDNTPYIKRSDVAMLVFLAGTPSTLTSRPTGHCTDW